MLHFYQIGHIFYKCFPHILKSAFTFCYQIEHILFASLAHLFFTNFYQIGHIFLPIRLPHF